MSNTYNALVEIVTTSGYNDIIAALQSATRADLEAIIEEYDLAEISVALRSPEDLEAVAKGALAAQVEQTDPEPETDPAQTELAPAVFRAASGGYAMDVESRLRIVSITTDVERLTDALTDPSLQKTVVTAITDRIKELHKAQEDAPTKIDIDRIAADSVTELQMREQVDQAHVDDLKTCLDELPPITVYQGEDGLYYIGDGWHRYLAHRLSSKKQIAADIHPGGRAAALKCALGANAEHNALRRTNRDKRKAVLIALKSYKSLFDTDKIKNVAVAQLCRVAESFVRKIRAELEEAKNPTAPAGKASDKTPGAQTDFFADLNRTFKSIEDSFKSVCNHSYFLDDAIETPQKVETLSSIESALQAQLQEVKDLRSKLTAQETAA